MPPLLKLAGTARLSKGQRCRTARSAQTTSESKRHHRASTSCLELRGREFLSTSGLGAHGDHWGRRPGQVSRILSFSPERSQVFLRRMGQGSRPPPPGTRPEHHRPRPRLNLPPTVWPSVVPSEPEWASHFPDSVLSVHAGGCPVTRHLLTGQDGNGHHPHALSLPRWLWEQALAPSSAPASGRLAGTATSGSDRLQGHCQE